MKSTKISELCSRVLGKQSKGFLICPSPIRSLRNKLPKDLAIAMCIFNPCNYKNPIENIKKCMNQFRPVPVFILELLQDKSSPSLKVHFVGASVTIHKIMSKSIMFHKENLWMILNRLIPEMYSKIVFLDSDILIEDTHSWAQKCSDELNDFQIIQPFSTIKFQTEKNSTSFSRQALLVAAKSLRCEVFDKTMNYPSPGYGVGVKRKWLKDVGGLIEYGVVGAGDLFTFGGLCDPDFLYQTDAYKRSPFAHKDIERFLSNAKLLNTKVGFVAHEGFHLYHGSRSNRNYQNRHEIMKDLCFEDLEKNKNGIIEFKDSHYSDKMLEYFQSRLEDT